MADWLRSLGYDTVYLATDNDPGDEELLHQAVAEQRVLITLDNDFGELIYHRKLEHFGLGRLPDVPATE